LGVTGVATFSAGTAALPAITTTGDTNTGIFFPAADTIAFSEGGAEAMRIDSSGNVGIGTTAAGGTLNVLSNTGSAVGIDVLGRSSDNLGTIRLLSNNAGTNYGSFRASASSVDLMAVANVPLTFYTNNAEKMRIDTSGNVGIGTTSPAGQLDVSQSTAGVARHYLRNTSNSVSAYTILDLVNDSGNNIGEFFCTSSTNTSSFGTNATVLQAATSNPLILGTNGTERARIDSAGAVLVGATAPTNAGKFISFFNSTTNVGLVSNDTSATAGATYFIASNNGTNIGSIARVGATSAVVYNTTSDQRLKSNITDSNSVLPTLMNVKVRQFDWTEGEVHQDYGFIAQELESTLSGVVTRGKTEDDMWQMDYARLTPHLVKAIQEQQALIQALTARITALEAK
jgi:hypothetical protein